MLYHNLKILESKLDTLLYSLDKTPETTSKSSASRLKFTIPKEKGDIYYESVDTFCIDKNTAECFLNGNESIGKPLGRISDEKITGVNTYWTMGPIVDITNVIGFLNTAEQLTCTLFSLLCEQSLNLRIVLTKPNGQPCTLEYKKQTVQHCMCTTNGLGSFPTNAVNTPCASDRPHTASATRAPAPWPHRATPCTGPAAAARGTAATRAG